MAARARFVTGERSAEVRREVFARHDPTVPDPSPQTEVEDRGHAFTGEEEFGDRDPAVERGAGLADERGAAGPTDPTPARPTVRLWEDDPAWASHERSA